MSVQFDVRSRSDKASGINDKYLVRTDNSGKPVGDDEGGTPFHEHIKGLLDSCFRSGIERGRSLVENKDIGVGDNRPCNRNALFLSAGKFESAFSNHRIKPFRERLDEVEDFGFSAGIANFFGGDVILYVFKISAKRVIKERRILKDRGELRPIARKGKCTDVGTVNLHGTLRRLVESQKQVGDGRFSRSGMPNEGNARALRNFKRNVIQYGTFSSWISKRYALEFDRIGNSGKFNGSKIGFFFDNEKVFGFRGIGKLGNDFTIGGFDRLKWSVKSSGKGDKKE